MWGGGTFESNLSDAINRFVSTDKAKDQTYLRKLKFDIVNSYINYGATPAEYFLLDLQNADKHKRQTFVTDKLKDEMCLRTISIEKFNTELTDKYNFYLKNKSFFHRDVYLIDAHSDLNDFIDFFQKHRQLFLKPIDGSYGSGAHVVKFNDIKSAGDIFTELQKKGRWCAEELIIQTDEMAEWNPTSVNTVRIPSFWVNGRHHVLAPFFRTGRKGAVIDNAGGGGIFAAIDSQNGTICSDGFSETNQYYSVHPESGKKYKGWKIPHWDELIKTSKEIHKNMPDHRYIAFDFALTQNGWVLIEGNWGQFIWQYATKTGLKNQFVKLMS